MERFRGKKVLIVGIGKTGFKLINFFNRIECMIKVTDIKPIFDLNKAVKKLKRIKPAPEMTFGDSVDSSAMELIRKQTDDHIRRGKFVISLGAEHTVTYGLVKAHLDHYKEPKDTTVQ